MKFVGVTGIVPGTNDFVTLVVQLVLPVAVDIERPFVAVEGHEAGPMLVATCALPSDLAFTAKLEGDGLRVGGLLIVIPMIAAALEVTWVGKSTPAPQRHKSSV